MKSLFKPPLILHITSLALSAALSAVLIALYPGEGRLVFIVCGIVICQLASLALALAKDRRERDFKRYLARYLDVSDIASLDDAPIPEEYREIVELINAYHASLIQKTGHKETQLQVLVSQINPHFLYNTLESIRGQSICAGDDIVADMLEMLALFYRYSISQKGMLVALRDELQNVDVYIRIMQFRFANKFTYARQLQNDASQDCEIPKLTLQPIIENAIQHGLQNFTSGGELSLKIQENEDSLDIYVQDNGVGIPNESLKQLNKSLVENAEPSQEPGRRHGIALYNINRRLRLLYGARYGLHVFSTEQVGTTVWISMPKKKYGSSEQNQTPGGE